MSGLAPFTVDRPSTAAKAVEVFRARSGVRAFKAGGTDLLDVMKRGVFVPDHLIHLGHIDGMNRIDSGPQGELRIGARVTLAALGEDRRVLEFCPALARAAGETATPQIRNVATVGGNLCQQPRCWYFRQGTVSCFRKGGPACEAAGGDHRYHAIFGGGTCRMAHSSSLAPQLIAWDASLVLRDEKGTRVAPLESLYRIPEAAGENECTLSPGDLIEEIRLPAHQWSGGWYAVKEREGPDWPLVTAAVTLKIERGKIATCRVVLGAAAPIPWRAREVEAALVGSPAKPDRFAAAAETLKKSTRPLTGNGYKVRLAQTAVVRALRLAAGLPAI